MKWLGYFCACQLKSILIIHVIKSYLTIGIREVRKFVHIAYKNCLFYPNSHKIRTYEYGVQQRILLYMYVMLTWFVSLVMWKNLRTFTSRNVNKTMALYLSPTKYVDGVACPQKEWSVKKGDTFRYGRKAGQILGVCICFNSTKCQRSRSTNGNKF